MPAAWTAIPLDAKWFSNVQETSLTKAHAAVENCFLTEANGVSRFPGLKNFVNLPGEERVFLHDFRDDLIAVTGAGRMYRMDKDGNVEDVTQVPISGGRRPTFTETDEYLAVAAGGPIIAFDGQKTTVLSENAPLASHLGSVDNYLLAAEINSDRFQYSNAGAPRQWSSLDTFAASGSPDPVNALLVTDFREVIVGGPRSIEQYERLTTGDPPFFRRWSVGGGILAPYTMIFEDNAVWAVNQKYEFSRYSGQTGKSVSDDIGRSLEKVDDWTDAWATSLLIEGQKFILLAIPHATNPYGTKGLTLLLDYRQSKWLSLYGWITSDGIPARWPGWSYRPLWKRHFVGGEGKIFELTDSTYWHAGEKARMLIRTAPMSELGSVRIDAIRMRLKRGIGTNTAESYIRLRAARDGKPFGNWVRKGFGKAGQRDMYIEFGGFGCATVWQFEIEVTDDCDTQLVKMDAQITQLGP